MVKYKSTKRIALDSQDELTRQKIYDYINTDRIEYLYKVIPFDQDEVIEDAHIESDQLIIECAIYKESDIANMGY